MKLKKKKKLTIIHIYIYIFIYINMDALRFIIFIVKNLMWENFTTNNRKIRNCNRKDIIMLETLTVIIENS